jgi:hypothetical protein
MRIYCDSNIFRKTKPASKDFKPSWFNSLESLSKDFIFLFSEAHLNDLGEITDANRQFIIEDLNHIETYVKNSYLYRDHVKKTFHYYLATPAEAYQGMDFAAINNFFDDPQAYMDSLFDFEGGQELGEMMETLYNLPIFSLDKIDLLGLSEDDPLNNFKDVKTINDALKQFQGYGEILSSKLEYKKYRNLFSGYTRREEYSYDKWSFEFNERMKDTVYQKTFSELVDLTIADADKNDKYTRFINTYTNLEFFGVTLEKEGTTKKNKKNSFWDIHRDATHAYYASYADYLVSEDKGMLTKAFITYKLLNIDTQVLSPEDFVNRAAMLLKNEDTSDSFFEGLQFMLQHGKSIIQTTLDQPQIIKSSYPILNYFNRIQINKELAGHSLQLYRASDSHKGVMYVELQTLIMKCNKLFRSNLLIEPEETLTNLGGYITGESIRNWKVGKSLISLYYSMNTLQHHIIVLEINLAN